MNIVVFYDKCFEQKFGNMSASKVRAIMAIVEEIFSEKDTLQTTIEFSDDFPIVPKLESNWCDSCWMDIFTSNGELANIVRNSGYEADQFIFLTNVPKWNVEVGGLAHGAVVCHPDKGHRKIIATYHERQQGIWFHNPKSGVFLTAEVGLYSYVHQCCASKFKERKQCHDTHTPTHL